MAPPMPSRLARRWSARWTRCATKCRNASPSACFSCSRKRYRREHHRMIYSRIAGTGSYLPPRVMLNAEFAKRLDTSDTWIRERTGIAQRHIADESQASSDLALHASRAAMEAAGVQAKDIDLIIVGTSTPDFIFPSTACLLQAKLGVTDCAAFDVQAVCSGFVYALAT